MFLISYTQEIVSLNGGLNIGLNNNDLHFWTKAGILALVRVQRKDGDHLHQHHNDDLTADSTTGVALALAGKVTLGGTEAALSLNDNILAIFLIILIVILRSLSSCF